MAHRVAVVVPADFTLFELGVAVEAFATAPRPELAQDWYDVDVCTAHPGPTAAGGLFSASIRHGVELIAQADTVIVPQAQSLLEEPDPLVLDALRTAYQQGARMISFCTGAFVLAAAGILDGRPATTHWKYTRRLALQYPRVRVNPDVLYIDDGQVLTSAGTAAGIDLSLHVIGRDHGARVARQVAREMVVAPHRAGGQAQFVTTPVPDVGEEDAISRTMSHALDNLDADLSLAELAGIAFMSTRNFSRRFREVAGTTPARWVFHQRLARARELLEETDLPMRPSRRGPASAARSPCVSGSPPRCGPHRRPTDGRSAPASGPTRTSHRRWPRDAATPRGSARAHRPSLRRPRLRRPRCPVRLARSRLPRRPQPRPAQRLG